MTRKPEHHTGARKRGNTRAQLRHQDSRGATEAIVVHSADPVDATIPEPRNHRELAEAIFAKCDPVAIGCELLESGSEKGASVRARIFETLANWQFGKQADAPQPQRKLRVIWDLPCPPHEPLEPEE